MGLWRCGKWWLVWAVLVLGVASSALAAEPYPPPPPEPPSDISDVPLAGDWRSVMSEEERAVVENLEFLEMMEILEHLEMLRDWEAVTSPPPPSDYETSGPTEEELSYGDVAPR